MITGQADRHAQICKTVSNYFTVLLPAGKKKRPFVLFYRKNHNNLRSDLFWSDGDPRPVLLLGYLTLRELKLEFFCRGI